VEAVAEKAREYFRKTADAKSMFVFATAHIPEKSSCQWGEDDPSYYLWGKINVPDGQRLH